MQIGEMIPMLVRHEIQVLVRAGHKQTDVSKRTGVPVRTIRRVLDEDDVEHADDRAERSERKVGRPSTATPFAPKVMAWLQAEPELPTQELLRRAKEAGYEGRKTAFYTLVAGLRPPRAAPVVRFEGLRTQAWLRLIVTLSHDSSRKTRRSASSLPTSATSSARRSTTLGRRLSNGRRRFLLQRSHAEGAHASCSKGELLNAAVSSFAVGSAGSQTALRLRGHRSCAGAGRPRLESAIALTPHQRRVLIDIERCRTAAFGGHLDQCVSCGYEHPSYNSCRNRHCPKCQALAQERKWIEAQRARMLDTPHFHVVFTLPAELRPLAAFARRRVFNLLFVTSRSARVAATLSSCNRSPSRERH
jgi:hypothetical protein